MHITKSIILDLGFTSIQKKTAFLYKSSKTIDILPIFFIPKWSLTLNPTWATAVACVDANASRAATLSSRPRILRFISSDSAIASIAFASSSRAYEEGGG